MRNFFARHPFVASLLKRSITVIVIWNIVVSCLIGTVLFFGGFFSGVSEESSSNYTYLYGDGYNELLSIKVDGTIVGAGEDEGFAGWSDYLTSGYTVKEKLYAAAHDDMIKGVVLEINSPGGTIYGARAIADGVKYYKDQSGGKPVIAHISGQGASGAYWAAASTDKILADYGSDTGSIGVIMGPFQYYNKPLAEDGGAFIGGVVTQNGIETTTFTAGKSKDAGNPYRRLTDAEITALQRSVDNEYDAFVAYVAEHRKIDADVIRNHIGALTYDNKTALAHKLIDGTSNREDAYEALAKSAGVEDDFTVIREEPEQGFIATLLSAVAKKPQPQAKGDLCTLTRSALAYHGDTTRLCTR